MEEEDAIKLIPAVLAKAKQEYEEARKWMGQYLRNDPKEPLETPKSEEPEAPKAAKSPGKKPVETPNGVRRPSIPV